jgi:quinol monooxygenase YgiN/mannose-6-phosphate isomerase-like protein (cupin superfamily)
MPTVGRIVKLTAHEGHGEALAQTMLRVAAGLERTRGCEQYVINRSVTDPDVIWITERWLNQEALDASLEALQTDAGKTQVAEVMALVAGSERIDVEPLGGVGYLSGGHDATVINLDEVEDQAPKFGLGEQVEARFANRDLGAVRTGISHQRLRPGVRQSFGHRHHHAEEIYVVLAGSGRVKLDDAIRDVKALDAIRVAPRCSRAFEAGPDGLEVLVVGPAHPGDVEVLRDFWTD